MSPLLPIELLLLGAVALSLGLLPRFRYTGLIAIVTALAALLALVGLGFYLPSHAVLIEMVVPAPGFPEPESVRTVVDEASLIAMFHAIVPRSSRTVVERP